MLAMLASSSHASAHSLCKPTACEGSTGIHLHSPGLLKGLIGCRMYIEQYSDDVSKHKEDAQAALAPIISVALDISKLAEFTGRDKPTVIT